MQVSTSYLEWNVFVELAGPDFEDKYCGQWDSEEGVQGVMAIDDQDDFGDSFFAWDGAREILSDCVPRKSAWNRFVKEAFISQTPSPRNDLPCDCDPELIAAAISNDSVKEIVAPLLDQSFPVTEDDFALAANDLTREIFPDFKSFREYTQSWINIWTKAYERDLGILYHIG